VKFSVKLGASLSSPRTASRFGIEVSSRAAVLWFGAVRRGRFNFVEGTGTIFAGVKAAG
jgi:hypothetical protein